MGELSVSSFPNGVMLIAAHRPTAATQALGLWVRVGARDEPPGLAGATHWLEHLMFRGNTPGAAANGGEPRGRALARLGGQVNGGVGREALALQGWVPRESAPALAGLLIGMLREPALTVQALDAERVRISREGGAGTRSLAWALPGHALANPIPGDARALAKIAPEALRQWWREHCTGGRIAAIAAGAWDAAALCAACVELRELPAQAGPEPDATSSAWLRLVPASGDFAAAPAGTAGWLLPGPVLGEAGEWAFRLAERWVALALGAEPFGAPVVGAPVVSRLEFTRGASLWSLSLALADTVPAEAARTLEDALGRLVAEGPDPVALEAARCGLLAQVALEADDPPGALARLGEEWIVSGAAREREALRSGITAVSADAAQAALREALARALPFGWPRP